MASEELIGMEVDAAATLDAGWMLELLGIPVSATRRKCALRSLKGRPPRAHQRQQLGEAVRPDNPDRYSRLLD